MKELNIPLNLRGPLIRFCRHGVGDEYDRQGYFWDESRLKWGQYAPVEDRSRVYKTMEDMWKMYADNKRLKI